MAQHLFSPLAKRPKRHDDSFFDVCQCSQRHITAITLSKAGNQARMCYLTRGSETGGSSVNEPSNVRLSAYSASSLSLLIGSAARAALMSLRELSSTLLEVRDIPHLLPLPAHELSCSLSEVDGHYFASHFHACNVCEAPFPNVRHALLSCFCVCLLSPRSCILSLSAFNTRCLQKHLLDLHQEESHDAFFQVLAERKPMV